MTSLIDVDKTGGSYYGEQRLFYLSSRGEGNMVPLGTSSVSVQTIYTVGPLLKDTMSVSVQTIYTVGPLLKDTMSVSVCTIYTVEPLLKDTSVRGVYTVLACIQWNLS